jgi:tetratricopeptide (TPR) repeat protein
MAHRHSQHNPEENKPTYDNTQPPRFWKGFYTDSKDAGEMQLTLLWEQGENNKDALIMSFLLDFWQEGVKDFFSETNSKRHIDSHLNEMRRQFAHIKLVNCTPSEARRLLQEALSVNKKRGTRPHPDFTRDLPLINELILNAPGNEEDEEDWDEDEDELSDLTPGPIASSPFLSSSAPPFPGLDDATDPAALLRSLFGGIEVEPVIADFLQAWSVGDYASAYDMLTEDSPLRDGLTSDEWVAVRKQWSAEARPARLSTLFLEEREEDFEEDEDEEEDLDEEEVLGEEVLEMEKDEDEDEEFEEDEEPGPPVVEAGWSLEFTDTPLSQRIKELPTATAFLPETKRHWFWTSYTLHEDEEGDYLIHDMTDEGASLLQLSPEELEARLDAMREEIEHLAQDLKGEDEEEEEEDFEDEELEEEDEEEEEEDFEDEEFLDTLSHMRDIIATTTRLNYYCDALMAKTPPDEPEVYDSAVQNATLTQDFEHAAFFLQQKARQFPDQRGDALSLLAMAYIEAAARYAEDGNKDEEQQNRFRALAEQAAQEAINVAKTPKAYIILAQIWIEYDKNLEEAEALLHEAEKLSPDSQEAVLIEVSFARLAEKRQDIALALEHYKRASQIQPDFPALWTTMGKLQRDLGQNDEAEKSLLYSVETEPEEIDAYIGLAELYTNVRNDFQKAKDILQKGLEVDPQSPDIYIAFTLLYMQRNDFQTAERYLEQAEELAPDMDFVQEMRKTFDIEKAEHRRSTKARQQQKTSKSKGHKPRKR